MAAYEGIAAYIATSAEGDTVVDLEMDIPAGWTLVIAQPKGHGGSSRSFPGVPFLWIPDGNYYYITNVVDTQENAWGYCMALPAEDDLIGTMPTTIVTSPLDAGTDTITVTIARESGTDLSDPAFVSRVLAFSGIVAYDPPNGCPVAMHVPRFNSPFNGTSFFSLDPDDAIPLPQLVAVQDGSPIVRQEIPFQEYPPSESNTDPQFLLRTFAATDLPATPSLFIASIMWDGTTPGWDYYYTTGAADPSPGFTVGPQPSSAGLSTDHGTFYFDAINSDDGWVDIEYDAMGAALEARYAYLLLASSPAPDEMVIGGDYDAANGVWGDSGPQVDNDDPDSPSLTPGADTSYPFAPDTWDGTPNPSPPPAFSSIYPLGDPNIIESPVWPTMSFIEGIATGVATSITGTYFFRSRTPAVGSVDT